MSADGGILEELRSTLLSASRVVLSTHVNADGDGAGSEAALGHWLQRHGVAVTLVNPTPYPSQFDFLLQGLSHHTPDQEPARRAVERAELAVVLDTSESHRLGRVWEMIEGMTVAVVDHHPPSPEAIGDPAIRDPDACATGEILYDFFRADGEQLRVEEARGLYVAVVTDTGSFRFSNTSPRAHRIAATLLEAGVNPQEMYGRLYGTMTMARVKLLRRALDSLRVDPEHPVAWIKLHERDIRRTGADTEDQEGIVEYARRVEGVEVAVLFRELPDGRTKASLRSNGPADVAEIARRFGGGGHPKAAGAVVELPVGAAVGAVLTEVRHAVGARGR